MKNINFYAAVYRVVQKIPLGKVTTYGSIATWLGSPRAARAVGYALAADLSGDVPWHRVINCQGRISEGGAPWRAGEQRRRLEAEGITFCPLGILDLAALGFRPSPAQLRTWATVGEQASRTAAGRCKKPSSGP